jgi:hypothetical protein
MKPEIDLKSGSGGSSTGVRAVGGATFNAGRNGGISGVGGSGSSRLDVGRVLCR